MIIHIRGWIINYQIFNCWSGYYQGHSSNSGIRPKQKAALQKPAVLGEGKKQFVGHPLYICISKSNIYV